MLLNQISTLQARIAELEKALESAEAEVMALRAIAESKVEVETVQALA